MLKPLQRHIRFFQSLNADELSHFTSAWLQLLKLEISGRLKGRIAMANVFTENEERKISADEVKENRAFEKQVNLAVIRASNYHFFKSSEKTMGEARIALARQSPPIKRS